MARSIRANDRGGLRKAVALEHRHTHSAEILLEFDVEQGATSHKELHPASEIIPHSLEYELVEEPHQRLPPAYVQAAAVVVLLVVLHCVVKGEVVEFLHGRALCPDCGLYALLEVAGYGRDREHNHRTGLLYSHRYILEGGQGRLARRYGSDAGTV